MALRAAFFDLDGTLKLVRDPYRFVHERLGVWAQAEKFSALYAAGEIDSDEWIRRDVALWKGAPKAVLAQLFRDIPYTPGAREAIGELHARGVITVIISTGPQLHAEMVRQDLNMYHAVANALEFVDDICTGKVTIQVQEGRKGDILCALMDQLGLSPEECLAVGDNESDIDLFRGCAVGVAVQPASAYVRAAADIVLETADLSNLVERIKDQYAAWFEA